MLCRFSTGLIDFLWICLASLPAQAQITLPFSADYAGTQTSFNQITPTSEEDFTAFTSTNAPYGLLHGVDDVFLTSDGNGFVLTPNTTSTFDFTATDGSTLYGTFASTTITLSGQTQDVTSALVITGGTGDFQSATGSFAATGVSNADASVSETHATGSINLPAAVPEASSVVSLGVLLLFGLGGIVIVAKKAVVSA